MVFRPKLRSGFAIPGAIAALALIAAGCGGSNEDAPTKAQFIKRADAICTKADSRQSKALVVFQKKHPKSNASKAWKKKILLAAALPPVQVETEELAALSAPTGDEEKIAAIVTGMEDAVSQSRANPIPLLTSSGPFTGVDKLARGYGFKACVNPL